MGEGGSECVSQLIKMQTVRTTAILTETQKTAQTDDKKGINSTAIEKLSHYSIETECNFRFGTCLFIGFSFLFFFLFGQSKKR